MNAHGLCWIHVVLSVCIILSCNAKLFQVLDKAIKGNESNIVRTEGHSTYTSCILSCTRVEDCHRSVLQTSDSNNDQCLHLKEEALTKARSNNKPHLKTFEEICPCHRDDECQAESCGHSCKDIIEKYPYLSNRSGFYNIQHGEKLLRFYCDMATLDGGWLMITNFTINSTTEAFAISTRLHSTLDDFDTDDIFKGKVALNTAGLDSLRNIINFTQIRFFCYKPSVGSTFHVLTLKNQSSVIDYLTGRTKDRPPSCGTYETLSDDTSVLGRKCNAWTQNRWSADVHADELLYDHTVYMSGARHWNAGIYRNIPSPRWECDDNDKNKDIIGIWQIFVR